MRVYVVSLSCLVLIFAACTPTAVLDTSEDGGIEYGESAIVESVDLLIMESFPIQVRAVIKGDLPDGCTEIADVEISREDKVFKVTITTSRPVAAVCTTALEPFEHKVSLDVLDLPAGMYTVDAYGKTATFTFSVKNSVKEE